MATSSLPSKPSAEKSGCSAQDEAAHEHFSIKSKKSEERTNVLEIRLMTAK